MSKPIYQIPKTPSLPNYSSCQTSQSELPYLHAPSTGKPGRKLDELKERYQKACKKLHQVHNDYVLLLCEAADYERDFRTVLLPGLLEYQERVQEDMIDKW